MLMWDAVSLTKERDCGPGMVFSVHSLLPRTEKEGRALRSWCGASQGCAALVSCKVVY